MLASWPAIWLIVRIKNPTAQAIRQRFQGQVVYPMISNLPFSSDRKWGAMELEGLGTVFLGAPEMLLDSEVPEAREALERGSRVLVLALRSGEIRPPQTTETI